MRNWAWFGVGTAALAIHGLALAQSSVFTGSFSPQSVPTNTINVSNVVGGTTGTGLRPLNLARISQFFDNPLNPRQRPPAPTPPPIILKRPQANVAQAQVALGQGSVSFLGGIQQGAKQLIATIVARDNSQTVKPLPAPALPIPAGGR